ncbi:alpha/beta hydrolase [Clostridium sp. ZS2-4]|uniref:alpha/beta hydrolase n=1 Tax=Clostridium sp. ZS2-4 TaxID=2987703 RepID=UPI00227B75E3|nr:alpha/beta hydrolase [Clostridium sp. ZS2-4]MCY6355562.1 lysophospholipase [Clostridium sp. ZS2-4]
MIKETFSFKDKDGLEIFVYKWSPEKNKKAKAVLQIAHGMAETAARYENLAEQLTKEGYIIYANDHRGHGKTAKEVDKLGELGENGFEVMVDNMHQLTEIIEKENSKLPIFLLGHSMGSFLTQRYICLYGKELEGAILSGTNGSIGIMADIGRIIAKREIKRIGRSEKSERMDKLSFGGYNKAFKPNRTKFDWLSRDEKEVDKYIEDPFCGTVFTAGFFYDLLGGLKLIANKNEISRVPKTLPIYIFSGDKDPVGKNGRGVLRLVKAYKKVGIKDLTYKLYTEGRHEMLNEMNRDEVIKDLLLWLEDHLQK